MLAPEILKFPWLRGRADEVVDTIGHLVILLNPSHFEIGLWLWYSWYRSWLQIISQLNKNLNNKEKDGVNG